jgi:hypothetical protein
MNNLVKQSNTMTMMSNTIALFSEMNEDLANTNQNNLDLEALTQVVRGVRQVADGLTKLIADHAKILEAELIVQKVIENNAE